MGDLAKVPECVLRTVSASLGWHASRLVYHNYHATTQVFDHAHFHCPFTSHLLLDAGNTWPLWALQRRCQRLQQ